MNEEIGYLSDEELDALIFRIEQNEQVMAPPCIKERLLYRTKNKKRDFRMYCFRVVASVAAAIVMLFMLPQIMGNIDSKTFDAVSEGYESEMTRTDIPTRQEVLATQKYASKEEVLDETGFLQKIIQSIPMLEQSIDFQIMNGQNGGK